MLKYAISPTLRHGLRRLAVVAGALALLWGAAALVPRVVSSPPLSRGYPSSVAVYDASERHLLRLTLAADESYRLWTPLAEISPALRRAVLLYEDRAFDYHPGVNPAALARAAWTTYVGGGRRVGGSTITMQLARRLYKIRSSSLAGKLRQVGRALQLELLYSKSQILEAHLNLVPMGRNIEGAGAASLIYFGKPAAQLLAHEALVLALIPQNPGRRAPRRSVRSVGALPPALEAARAALARRWTARNSPGSLMDLPLSPRSIEQLPFRAPHLVHRVLARHALARPVTTVDWALQRTLKRHLRAYIDRRRRIGLRNAAAMLVDFRDMAVRASVGSVDYFDGSIAGQVDGTRARRSPGSTLKPLIYALGLEQGVIHPLTMLKDAPLTLAGFRPENADSRFAGPLSATEALVRSRNIPALAVAAKLHDPDLHGLLQRAGIKRLRSREHYGLALVLGGGEVTMEELVRLYAALAHGGRMRPLRLLQRAPVVRQGRRILGRRASHVALRMLAHNPRPDRPRHIRSTDEDLPVYWKTGTSNGFRDAWSVGVFGPYVLAVWVGNFSGRGDPALMGRRAAAPLFFEIVDSIRAQAGSLPRPLRKLPPGLRRLPVCAVSGALPGPHCSGRIKTWFIPGKSPITRCQVHRTVIIDRRTGLRSCPPHRGPTVTRVFEFWPSDILALYHQAGIPRRLPPPAGASCAPGVQASHGAGPRIVSPQLGLTYNLGAVGSAHTGRIGLSAVFDADVRQAFWFVNHEFVGRQQPGSPLLWQPRAGTFMVRVVDDQGRSDVRRLVVEPG